MSAILTQIVERTRQRLRFEPRTTLAAAEAVARSRTAFAFSTAIGKAGVNVIAEIKAASPSAGPIAPEPDVETIAGDYLRGGAAAISVVTEPDFFKGDRAWVARARTAGLPVIMKDFIVDPRQIVGAVAAGADAVLLLASLLDAHQLRDFTATAHELGCDVLVEVHDERELVRATAASARLIGVNNRDLRTFEVRLETAERLAPLIPRGAVRVAESGIRSRSDVLRLQAAGFGAFLVGESLLRQNDRAGAVRALREGALS